MHKFLAEPRVGEPRALSEPWTSWLVWAREREREFEDAALGGEFPNGATSFLSPDNGDEMADDDDETLAAADVSSA